MATDRRRRRQEERAAKGQKKANLGFWDRISTDMIMGGLILGVIGIAAIVFIAGRLVNRQSAPAEIPFEQVFTVSAVPGKANTLLVGDVTGLYRTTDNGAKWDRVAFNKTPVHAIDADPTATNVLYAAAGDKLRRSDDSGGSWKDVATNLPVGSIVSLASDPSGTKSMYAFVEHFGLYRSDNGQNWQQSVSLPDDELTSVAIKPGAVDTLYAFHTTRGLVKSSDGGKNFNAIAGNNLPARTVTSLLTIPDEPESVFAVAGRTVYKSTDGGTSWKSSAEGLKDVAMVSITRDPSGTLYAADIQATIYKSADGGKSWSRP